MIVVSDATPINFLVQLKRIGLLHTAYGFVYLPPAVLAELDCDSTAAIVRAWVRHLPPWVVVRPTAQAPSPTLMHLDAGEREALALALEISADIVLVDDLQARNTARRMGLPLIGTLGILARAAERDGFNYEEEVGKLLALGFRASPETIRKAAP